MAALYHDREGPWELQEGCIMPVAICPQCCRDYYLPAGSEDEARCEKCACALVWLDELRAGNADGLPEDDAASDAPAS